MRAFLAHPKAWNDGQIESVSAALKAAMEAKTGQQWAVVPGRDDYSDNIYSDGSFSAWAQAVPRRIDSFTRDRFYTVIVLPTDRMGKGTAAILEAADQVGTPAIYMAPDHTLYQIDELVTEDEQDYQNGWFIVKGATL